jgi:hypothetical protein
VTLGTVMVVVAALTTAVETLVSNGCEVSTPK